MKKTKTYFIQLKSGKQFPATEKEIEKLFRNTNPNENIKIASQNEAIKRIIFIPIREIELFYTIKKTKGTKKDNNEKLENNN